MSLFDVTVPINPEDRKQFAKSCLTALLPEECSGARLQCMPDGSCEMTFYGILIKEAGVVAKLLYTYDSAPMPHFALVTWIKAVGYPGISAIVFLESGVPIGFFLPGASMLFTAGLLSSKGFFNPWILIPLVTIAAILGDNVGYWFGRKVGVRLFLRPNSKWFKHEHLEKAKNFFDQYGARAIFFGRFLPVVRTFAPIVAGVVGMNYQVFLTYNIFGALCWAAGTTFLGYYLGAKVPFVSNYLTPIILCIIVITTLPLLRDYWRRRSYR